MARGAVLLGALIVAAAGAAQERAPAPVAKAPAVRAAGGAGGGSEGERLYRQGRYREALAFFRKKAAEDGPTATLAYDAGNALYRLGRYEEAAASYRDALAAERGLRRKAQYNLGNAFFKSADAADDKRATLESAVNAYEEALILNPGDRDAKWNLELALRKLEAEQQRQAGGGGGGENGPQNQPQGGAGPDRQSTGGGGGPEPPSAPQGGEPPDEAPSGGLTEQQARQLLAAIQSEETETVESREQRTTPAASGRKDW